MSTGKSPALAKESKGNIWPQINCHLKFLTGDPIAFNREKLSNRENVKQKSILENTRSKKQSEEGCAPKYDAPSLLGHFCPPLWQNWWEQQAGRQSQPQDKLFLQSQEIYFAESREFTSTVWRPPLQLLSVSEIAASQPSPLILAEEPWLKKGETISVKHFSTQPQHSLCLFPFVSSLGTTEKRLAPSSVLPPIKYLHTRVRPPRDLSQLNIPETKYSRNRAFSACKEALLDFMLCYTFIGDSSAFFE